MKFALIAILFFTALVCSALPAFANQKSASDVEFPQSYFDSNKSELLTNKKIKKDPEAVVMSGKRDKFLTYEEYQKARKSFNYGNDSMLDKCNCTGTNCSRCHISINRNTVNNVNNLSNGAGSKKLGLDYKAMPLISASDDQVNPYFMNVSRQRLMVNVGKNEAFEMPEAAVVNEEQLRAVETIDPKMAQEIKEMQKDIVKQQKEEEKKTEEVIRDKHKSWLEKKMDKPLNRSWRSYKVLSGGFHSRVINDFMRSTHLFPGTPLSVDFGENFGATNFRSIERGFLEGGIATGGQLSNGNNQFLESDVDQSSITNYSADKVYGGGFSVSLGFGLRKSFNKFIGFRAEVDASFASVTGSYLESSSSLSSTVITDVNGANVAQTREFDLNDSYGNFTAYSLGLVAYIDLLQEILPVYPSIGGGVSGKFIDFRGNPSVSAFVPMSVLAFQVTAPFSEKFDVFMGVKWFKAMQNSIILNNNSVDMVTADSQASLTPNAQGDNARYVESRTIDLWNLNYWLVEFGIRF